MPNAPIRDISMYFEEHGAGDPLVLIMGFGADLQAWALQAPAFARHFRVVTFDNRGSGRSSAPDKPYSMEGMAEDTLSLMDRLGIEKAHVLGWSMGGYIAQELALAHPERVDKLVLMTTAPSIDGYGRTVLRGLMDARQSSMSYEQFVRLMSAWLYSPELLDNQARYERAIANVLANRYPQPDHAFLRQGNAILGFDAGNRLAKLTRETLVVGAHDDILVPIRNSERLVKLLPTARMEVLPGGHLGCLEFPNEYNAKILEFLTGA
jgi:pimeloyl-ACP methyl ester carboxylesterase